MNGMTKKQVEIIENIIVLQKEFDKISLSNKDTPYLLLFGDSSNNYSERPLTPDNFYIQSHYNKDYGDERLCKCGHEYYRHFDSYDNMSNVGCKYCGMGDCDGFEEA